MRTLHPVEQAILRDEPPATTGVTSSMAPPTSSMPWPAPIGSGYQDDLEIRFRQAAQAAGTGYATLAGDLPRLPKGVVLRLPVRFHARGADYARLWVANLLLTLLTLGLYWPWARVRTQRFFLRHTTVAGSSLDYHAVPARLLPRYALVVGLLGGVVVAWRGSPLAGLMALSLGLAVMPLVVHVGLIHRMQHTSWAGRRLAFDSQIEAVYAALLLPLMGIVAVVWLLQAASLRQHPLWWGACGFAASTWLLGVPLFYWAYFEYRQNRLRMGPVRFLWKADFLSMLMVWGRTVAWLTLMLALVGGAGAVLLGGVLLARLPATPGVVAMLLGGALLAVGGAVLPYLQARLQNLVWSKTGHRALRFRSQLSVPDYVMLQVRHAVLLVLTLGLYWPWAVVASRRMRAQALVIWSRVDADVLKAHWPAYGRDRADLSTYPNHPETRL